MTEGSIKTFSFSLRATINGLSSTSGDEEASISGTLCRSDVCEAKLVKDKAAVSEERTHCRYGRKDWDWVLVNGLHWADDRGRAYHGGREVRVAEKFAGCYRLIDTRIID